MDWRPVIDLPALLFEGLLFEGLLSGPLYSDLKSKSVY